ncbi:Protein CHROMATIN REMODELING 19 [Orobanche minor]
MSSVQQKDDCKILRHWKWSCVIMDEAHALKDRNSYSWKNLMSITRNARQCLMLTGTPLQNDLHLIFGEWPEFKHPNMYKLSAAVLSAYSVTVGRGVSSPVGGSLFAGAVVHVGLFDA